MKMELKTLSDEELAAKAEDFARLNLTDRDDVIFDFEADIKRFMKKLDVAKLMRKNKKYIKNIKAFIMNMILQSYLKDIITVGEKKERRFKKYYLEA